MWYEYTMACYSAIEKEGKSVICNSMDGLSEISQTEKDKYYMISHVESETNKQTLRYRGLID